MARQHPIELFMPPNMLKAKAGSGGGGLDLSAIKRAENAMEALKPEFAAMANDDVKALAQARARYAADPGPDSRAALLRAAHNLKGQAATYDFALIARVASLLSTLLTEAPEGMALPGKLLDAHVTAIQVIQRQNLTGATDATALALIGELESQVAEILKKG